MAQLLKKFCYPCLHTVKLKQESVRGSSACRQKNKEKQKQSRTHRVSRLLSKYSRLEKSVNPKLLRGRFPQETLDFRVAL